MSHNYIGLLDREFRMRFHVGQDEHRVDLGITDERLIPSIIIAS